MSKKNIIIAIILLIAIASLVVVYKSNLFFEKNSNELIILDEEDIDQPSHESRRQSTEISDEACIEINACFLRMSQIGIKGTFADPRIMQLNERVKQLEKKYEVDSGSDYFINYCENRLEDITILERTEEEMIRLGADIE